MAEPQQFFCEAYGEAGAAIDALCFIAGEPGARLCSSAAACHRAMTAERRRLFRRINELAAAGDPDMAFLAGQFTDPEQLLNPAAHQSEETE